MLRPSPHLLSRRITKAREAQQYALACPKICPEWQWGAFRALIKPQYQGAIKYRSSEQRWPARARSAASDAVALVHAKLGARLAAHFPPAGDYHWIVEVPAADLEAAKGLAVAISRRLPELWFTLGKWYIRDGQFFRKHRSYNVLLKPASNVHMSRSTWIALRGALRDGISSDHDRKGKDARTKPDRRRDGKASPDRSRKASE